ncbi:MAG: hypothetical protein ABIR81_10755 [Ginsengibacter sp.]
MACILLFLTLFTACHNHLVGNETLSIEVIKITGSDSTTGQLTLEDINGRPADVFSISPGAKMQWLLKAETVKDITNIYAKPDNPNVFSHGPRRRGNSVNWGGQIDSQATGKEENYNIDWTDKAGNPHTFDPKIQVK